MLWKRGSVVPEKIGDQGMIVGSFMILIIKGPKGEAVERGDPEKRGENLINRTRWQTLKGIMGFLPF
jgi:hypothetical protein